MRNWNKSGSCSSYSFLGVVPYLWGIETSSRSLVISKISGRTRLFRCTLPMRNWNKSNQLHSLLCDDRCTLPMRNWNFFLFQPVPLLEDRCTLPMRNWNYFEFWYTPFLLFYRLYLTYEELKHYKFSRQIKLTLLYLTYEELKPLLVIIMTSFVCIRCTLPMRNWNIYWIHA